ncbi:formate--tetrahydrofolate ligase [Deferribacterales bacterium RsTz2092]|nr:formate--tetrahydrofolate ligase [Deferribacterales bacterium]
MKSDIAIARDIKLTPITELACSYGIDEAYLEPYGKYKAKLNYDALHDKLKSKPDGKLVLVTAINPTPAGEGKTTTTIGLAQSLNILGYKTFAALREPSLGPCFGVKGGATGGGFAQIAPMDEINLHFTGDIHAITTTNNLLAAMIDNHIFQGNELKIDPKKILWRRSLDMNDRALRRMIIDAGGGGEYNSSFIISVASEIMAILCITSDLKDLKERLKRIIVAYSYDNKPIMAGDLNAAGAMTAILKDAINPNLVQTLEHTPVIVHGGPFANIAHGCNSIRATKLALKLGDIVVTEAGFGADLGAEKFLDIKCRKAGLKPAAVVLVATVRALKYNGGVKKDALNIENVSAVKEGLANLAKHIENLKKYNLPVVIALNSFDTDTDAEWAEISRLCNEMNVGFAISDVFMRGGNGGLELAEAVLCAINKPSDLKLLYEDSLDIKGKIEKICKEIYGAGSIRFADDAIIGIKKATDLGYSHFPVCIAKTQYSLSDNPKLLGRPTGFEVTIKEIRIMAGAEFIVALAGDIMTMPGLPKIPAACNIDVNDEGQITGLF